MQINEDKLNALLDRMVGEFGALASAPLVILGDRLGLYKAMAGVGPMTVDQFSERTHLRLRYAQEWLSAQAASGFVDYEPNEQTYALSPEAALVLADDSSPAFMGGGFECLPTAPTNIGPPRRYLESGTPCHTPPLVCSKRLIAESSMRFLRSASTSSIRTQQDTQMGGSWRAAFGTTRMKSWPASAATLGEDVA